MKPNTQTIIRICLATVLLFSASLAQPQTLTVRGLQSCGIWLSNKQNNKTGRFIGESWLIGYLSGLAIGTEKDFIKGTDNESIFLWMDNYCTANPLNDLADGGNVLYVQLIRQKRL